MALVPLLAAPLPAPPSPHPSLATATFHILKPSTPPPASGLTRADSLSPFRPTKPHSFLRPQLKPPSISEAFPLLPPPAPCTLLQHDRHMRNYFSSYVVIGLNRSSLMTRTVLIRHDIPRVRCIGSLSELLQCPECYPGHWKGQRQWAPTWPLPLGQLMSAVATPAPLPV